MIDGLPNSPKIIYELDDVLEEFRVTREHVNLLIPDASAYVCRAGKLLQEI